MSSFRRVKTLANSDHSELLNLFFFHHCYCCIQLIIAHAEGSDSAVQLWALNDSAMMIERNLCLKNVLTYYKRVNKLKLPGSQNKFISHGAVGWREIENNNNISINPPQLFFFYWLNRNEFEVVICSGVELARFNKKLFGDFRRYCMSGDRPELQILHQSNATCHQHSMFEVKYEKQNPSNKNDFRHRLISLWRSYHAFNNLHYIQMMINIIILLLPSIPCYYHFIIAGLHLRPNLVGKPSN